MKKVVFIAALIASSLAISFVHAEPSSAMKKLDKNVVKLVTHFKTGSETKCGIGTKCFIDSGGELQGWTITPRHIVIAHSINLGSGNSGKVRLYFIDRKTMKIVGMIPKKKNFSCTKLGNEGCYGHGSSLAYNGKTDKIWIAVREGYFQFNDQTMKLEKFYRAENQQIVTSKLTYNQQNDFYWGGATEANVFFDKNFKKIKSPKAATDDCKKYEEGPGTWGNYIVTNTYRHSCGQPRLRFYNHKTNKFIKSFEVTKAAIHTDVIEQVVFMDDGTMLLGIPNNNSLTGWGASTAIYAVSAKTLGIGASTNTKIGYDGVKAISIKLNTKSTTVKVGATTKLKVSFTPTDTTNKTINWTSSNTKVATVKNGTVTGLKSGTVTIMAKSANGKAAKATVKVVIVPATGVSISGSEAMSVNSSTTLAATVAPSNATYKNITWTTSDKTKATVSSAGKVTTYGKTGYVNITAKTHNGKTATRRIYIYSTSMDYVKAYYLDLTSNVPTINKERKAAKASELSNNQGILLETRDKKFILFDTGDKSAAIRNIIYNRLKQSQGAATKVVIDYLVISHFDGDHWGNAVELIQDQRILVRNVIIKNEAIAGKTASFTKVAKAAVAEGAWIHASSNMTEAKVKKLVGNNKAKVKILKEKYELNIGRYVKLNLFNVGDVFAGYVKNGKNPCKTGNIIQFTSATDTSVYKYVKAGSKYVYIDGSEYPNFSYKTSAKLVKKTGGSGMNRYFYAYASSSTTSNCSSDANSIASFVTVKMNGGEKYIYIPGDLSNAGYDFKPRSGIYGNGSTTLYNNPKFNASTKAFTGALGGQIAVSSETNVAKKIAANWAGKLGNIAFYEATNHGMNNAPDAMGVLGLTTNQNVYVIEMAKTSSQSSAALNRVRSYFYTYKDLPKAHVMNSGKGTEGIYCSIGSNGNHSCKYY